MGTTRRQRNAMRIERATRITLVLAATAAALLACVGTAAARTITPYIYSGTTITNPESGSGEFSCLAALGFDSTNQILYTGEGTETG